MDAAGVAALVYPTWNVPPLVRPAPYLAGMRGCPGRPATTTTAGLRCMQRVGAPPGDDGGNNSPMIAPHTGSPAITVPMGFTGEVPGQVAGWPLSQRSAPQFSAAQPMPALRPGPCRQARDCPRACSSWDAPLTSPASSDWPMLTSRRAVPAGRRSCSQSATGRTLAWRRRATARLQAESAALPLSEHLPS